MPPPQKRELRIPLPSSRQPCERARRCSVVVSLTQRKWIHNTGPFLAVKDPAVGDLAPFRARSGLSMDSEVAAVHNRGPRFASIGNTAMRVTIHDVAEDAGVSAMTVSRVINDSPRVSTETRRRVQASVAKLGYVPNRLARSLIQRKTGAFGVIVPDVANPFFTLI